MCSCPLPEVCELLGFHLNGRRYQILAGKSGLSESKRSAYIHRWLDRAGVTRSELGLLLPEIFPELRPPRQKPCIYLGKTLKKVSTCTKDWVRKCEIHGECTLRRCQSCAEYELEIL